MNHYSKTNCLNTTHFLDNYNLKFNIYETSCSCIKTNIYQMLFNFYDKIIEINNFSFLGNVYLSVNNYFPKEIGNYIIEFIDFRIIPSKCICYFVDKVKSSFNAFRFWLDSDIDFYRQHNLIQFQQTSKNLKKKSYFIEKQTISVIRKIKLIKNYNIKFNELNKKYNLNSTNFR